MKQQDCFYWAVKFKLSCWLCFLLLDLARVCVSDGFFKSKKGYLVGEAAEFHQQRKIIYYFWSFVSSLFSWYLDWLCNSEGIAGDSSEEVCGAARQGAHSHFSFRDSLRQRDGNPWESRRLQEFQDCTRTKENIFDGEEGGLLQYFLVVF